MVCAQEPVVYIGETQHHVLLLRFDIKLGFIPRPVLLLLSAREAIVNQTRTPSYLCLVILLTKFKGSLVSDSSTPTFSPSLQGLLELLLLRFSPEG